RRTLKEVQERGEAWKYPQLFDDAGNPRPDARQVNYADDKGTGFGVCVRVINELGDVRGTGNGLTVSGTDKATIVIAAATTFAGYDKDRALTAADPVAAAKAGAAAAAARSYDELLDRHVTDYRKLFDRVSLRLGEPTEQSALTTDERVRL